MSKNGLMLGAGCVKCGCKPCVPCTAECDPNTPVGFQVVYSNGNDGFLDSDESANPVNLFPAPVGPFHSEITNDIAITMPSDEFACSFRLLLWRNVFDKVGTPSEELSVQRLRISCSSGRVQIGDLFLNAGESILVTTEDNPATDDTYVIDGTWVSNVFDLVAGLDDQSGNPPPLLGGISAVPLCTPAVVNVQARIAWTSPDIHHVLYGQFLECYEEPVEISTCEVDCGGTMTQVPSVLYLTISNVVESPTNPTGYSYTVPQVAGTYALDFNPSYFCPTYSSGSWWAGRALVWFTVGYFGSFPVTTSSGTFFALASGALLDRVAGGLHPDFETLLCDNAPSISGTATISLSIGGALAADLGTIEFDWELST